MASACLPQMPESVTYVIGMTCNLSSEKHTRQNPSISNDGPATRRVSKRGFGINPDSYALSCIRVLASLCSEHETSCMARKLEGRPQGFPNRSHGQHGPPAFPGSAWSRSGRLEADAVDWTRRPRNTSARFIGSFQDNLFGDSTGSDLRLALFPQEVTEDCT